MAQKPPTLPQMPFPGRLHFRPANGAAAESPACLFPPPAAAARPSPGGEGAPVCKLGRMRWEATEGKTPHHRCAELPLKGKPINPETCTKETAKQLIAVVRTYYTFDVFARTRAMPAYEKPPARRADVYCMRSRGTLTAGRSRGSSTPHGPRRGPAWSTGCRICGTDGRRSAPRRRSGESTAPGSWA